MRSRPSSSSNKIGPAADRARGSGLRRRSATASRDVFDRSLRSVRDEVEVALDKIARELPDARLLITREIGFEPGDEELALVIELATRPQLRVLGDSLPLDMLALRAVVERQRRGFWDGRHLDPSVIQRTARILPSMLRAEERTRQALTASLGDSQRLTAGERGELAALGRALMPTTEWLVAAGVLGPRLEVLAVAALDRDIGCAVPHLDASEERLCLGVVQQNTEHGHGPSRAVVDAVLLRTLIQDEIEAWTELPADNADDRVAQIKRIRRDGFPRIEAAFRFVGDRLEQQREAALIAQIKSLVDETQRTHAELSCAFRMLAAKAAGVGT